MQAWKGLASSRSAPGALVIRCCLRIICPVKLPRFVEICDKSKGGTISLPECIRSRSHAKEKETFLPTWPTNPCCKPSRRSDPHQNHLHPSPARPANLRPTWPSPCYDQHPPPQPAYRLQPSPPRSHARLSPPSKTTGAYARGGAWQRRG